MITRLQKSFALSEKGAKDLIKACVCCAFQNISFMFPVGLLYFLVCDLLEGGAGERIWFYVIGCVVCIALVMVTTWFQYNASGKILSHHRFPGFHFHPVPQSDIQQKDWLWFH